MAEPLPKGMNADEFIAWAMEQPEGCHYELSGGEVVGMAAERLGHAIVKGLVFHRMMEEVKRLGLDCMPLPDGVSVRVSEHTVYEPDAMLRCGPRLPYDVVTIEDPLVVVEVRSRRTGYRDSGIKLVDYFQLPSLRHYLIVRVEDKAVIHHRRQHESADITTRIVHDGPIQLDPPGIVLRDIFPADIG